MGTEGEKGEMYLAVHLIQFGFDDLEHELIRYQAYQPSFHY